tara:strand:+ start:1999 stop:2313 length:315 start_codon:yes stop_codon:yes gene_type:complete
MQLINPYYTIFKENNWFLNNNKICYSDENVSVTDAILNIPFKNNKEYNKKILIYLNNFLQILQNRLCPFEPSAKIIYLFDENESSPMNASIIFAPNNSIQVLHL